MKNQVVPIGNSFFNPFAEEDTDDKSPKKKPVLVVQAVQIQDIELFRSLTLEVARESARDAAQQTARLVLEGLRKQRSVQPEYFLVEHAAMYISNTEDAFRSLLKEGKIPIIKLGTRIYIAKKDLDTFMMNNKQ
jgi:excisionase family DNA binding protein